ncbi:MAG: transcriptional regulator, partial [Acidobacteriota bacterium]
MHDSDRDSGVPPYFRVGDFLIRPTLKSVRPFRGFEVVSSIAEDRGLTDKAMAVLLYLAERPREVCLREQLLDTVWGTDREAYDRVLDNAISEIRRAFGDDSRSPRYVQTIPKQGYRLIAEVERPQRVVTEPADEPSPPVRPEGRTASIDRSVVTRRSLWLALGIFAMLLALGVWRWSIDDRIRVVVEMPQVEAEATDPATFSGWLEEALDDASMCSVTVQRRRLTWLSRFTLRSTLRREADGDLSLNLWLSDRGATPVLIESRLRRDDPALDALIGDAAGQVARAIDLAICNSSEPRGVERACHCREAGGALVARRRWDDARKALE